jgi:bifunctional N-acetylglucosamine-1-phosphate-uridyltransferase/glucosamine-1-phosphate-acetyltransferase GlmU-like protein
VQRTLIVPAAGRGSRLGGDTPKLLVPVAGRAMIDWLIDLYRSFVARIAIVVHPSALERVASHVGQSPATIDLFVQAEPTGMLDAILIASPAVERCHADRIWITWCDQVAMNPATVARLAREEVTAPDVSMIMPTCWQSDPYVHLERDATDRITRVLHRREGDAMPERGESDSGLFALSLAAYRDLLPEFARHVEPAKGTRERNFVPFVAWLAGRARVVTFPCTDPEEAIGVNTPEELTRIEAYLRARPVE